MYELMFIFNSKYKVQVMVILVWCDMGNHNLTIQLNKFTYLVYTYAQFNVIIIYFCLLKQYYNNLSQKTSSSTNIFSVAKCMLSFQSDTYKSTNKQGEKRTPYIMHEYCMHAVPLIRNACELNMLSEWPPIKMKTTSKRNIFELKNLYFCLDIFIFEYYAWYQIFWENIFSFYMRIPKHFISIQLVEFYNFFSEIEWKLLHKSCV